MGSMAPHNKELLYPSSKKTGHLNRLSFCAEIKWVVARPAPRKMRAEHRRPRRKLRANYLLTCRPDVPSRPRARGIPHTCMELEPRQLCTSLEMFTLAVRSFAFLTVLLTHPGPMNAKEG